MLLLFFEFLLELFDLFRSLLVEEPKHPCIFFIVLLELLCDHPIRLCLEVLLVADLFSQFIELATIPIESHVDFDLICRDAMNRRLEPRETMLYFSDSLKYGLERDSTRR